MRPSPPLLAPRVHTIGLVCLVLVFAAVSRFLYGGSNDPAGLALFGRPGTYSFGIITELLLIRYCGARLAIPARQVISPHRPAWTIALWLHYAGAALCAAIAWSVFGFLLSRIHALLPHPADVRTILRFLPKAPLEKFLWVTLSLTAGFCEEFVYRGYCLQQFHRLTRHLPAALVLQAALYASAHAALPWQIIVSVFFLGLLFGGLAVWQKSLVPGMLLHAAMDLLPGLLSKR